MTVSSEAQKRIENEEETLVQVLDSLEKQFSYGQSRLVTESARANSLTREIVASRSDSEKQMLASDEAVSHQLRDSKRDEIENIDRLLKSPYFARIQLEEEDDRGNKRLIEYKLGVAANTDCRIIDWRRAPIAKLYYEYAEGEDYDEEIQGRDRFGKILERNKLRIQSSELVNLACGIGSYAKIDGAWQESAGTSDRSSRGSLPNVLQLITAEQFRMITEEADSAVLIQGVAGSGKTTVALYRLAWLLHEDNSPLKKEDAVILVYSNTLKNYVLAAMPELDISGVDVFTFDDWTEFSLRKLLPATFLEESKKLRRSKRSTHPTVKRVKGGMATLLRLEEYAEELKDKVHTLVKERIPFAELGRDIEMKVEVFLERKLNLFSFLSELDSELSKLNPQSAKAQQVVTDSRLLLKKIKARLADYPHHVLRILENWQKLVGWDDTNLLDQKTVEETYTVTQSLFEQGIIDFPDDALILRLAQIFGETLHRNESLKGSFEHVMADEIQDFSAAELAVLIYAAESPNKLTLVGDASQQIGEYQTFPGWDRLRAHWSLGNDLSQFHALTVSHRSTFPIMKLGDHVLGEQRTSDGKKGKAPLWFACQNEEVGIEQTIGWLDRVSRAYPDSLIAVLCPNAAEARQVHSLLSPKLGNLVRLGDDSQFSFEEGILVTDILHAKGLEFEHVLIWNPSAEHYPKTQRARNALYVAITRTESHLCLVTFGEESPLLPSIDSKLVRGYPVEAVKEEKVRLLD